MFRQVRGWRVWVIALGTIVGLIGGIATTWQLTIQFLPPPLAKYAALLMMVGFAAALAALGTSDSKVDGVIYRENIEHRKKIEALERADHEHDSEVHSLRQQAESDRAVIAGLNDQIKEFADLAAQVAKLHAGASAALISRVIELIADLREIDKDIHVVLPEEPECPYPDTPETHYAVILWARGQSLSREGERFKQIHNEVVRRYELKFAARVRGVTAELEHAGVASERLIELSHRQWLDRGVVLINLVRELVAAGNALARQSFGEDRLP